MKNLTIAVIGGTGKSGKFVVRQLLEQQFNLKLLSRNPGNLYLTNTTSVQLLKGDIRHVDTACRLLQDCDAVVSTLGQPERESPVFSEATRNILSAMQQNGVKRYIVTTGLSVDTPFDAKNEKVSMATKWMYDHYPETTKDKQVEYGILSQSDLDWTLIRLPLITATEERHGFQTSLSDCPGSSISASDLGSFIAGELGQKNFIRQAPFLFNA